jgi:hypothetical protein
MINDQTTTGSVAIADRPLGQKKKKYRDFDVPSDVFRRFQTGRNKFERWSKYLNLQDETQFEIYKYAIRNRNATIILRDEETGALRSIRRKASNE